MPWLASVIVGGLLELMGSLAGRALLALGFGFVEYAGISVLADQVKAAMSGALSGGGMTEVMLAWAGFFMLDKHISIAVSAIGVKLAFDGLQSGSVRRLVQRK